MVDSSPQQLSSMGRVAFRDCEALASFLEVFVSSLTRLLSKNAETDWMAIKPLLNMAANDMDLPRGWNLYVEKIARVILESGEFFAERSDEISIHGAKIFAKTALKEDVCRNEGVFLVTTSSSSSL